MRSNAFRTLVAVGLAGALALAGCGVGEESKAHIFSSDEVPSGILDRSFAPTSTSGGTTTTLAPMIAYRLFFVRNGGLFEVVRTSVGEPSLSALSDSLSQGPTSAEIAAGFRSALGNSTVVSSVRANGALAQVDLTRSFADIPILDQTLAIGQITLTLTDRSDVLRVQFTMANVTIDVPKGDRSLTHEPVGADDFKKLVNLPTGPTTTVNASGATGSSGASGSSGATGATGTTGASGASGR